MDNKKVIVCDLDGTLAVSKSAIGEDMAEVICHILSKYYFAVVSGGAFPQFQKQFISRLKCDTSLFKNLYIFPTMGGMCYGYDTNTNEWKKIYDQSMKENERKAIISAFDYAIPKSGVDLSNPFGNLIEDRGTQVTFSGKGQEAPPDIKKDWDPDKVKRTKIVKLLQEKIPQFEFHMNGSTSIDVTRVGLDKAYAIKKIKELLKVGDEDIIFIGDALFPGGNDEPVKSTGVDFIQEEGPNQTLELLSRYM